MRAARLVPALTCAALAVACADAPLDPGVTVLDRAQLTSLRRTVDVPLPHALEDLDFDARGSRSTYRLRLHLDTVPTDPLAVFIPRVSSSGLVRVNGDEVGRCAGGALEKVRCVHHPTLIVPPRAAWRAGDNTIEVEVHANSMQVNGLSRVFVGPREPVWRMYLARHRLQVAPMVAFGWFMLGLGVVALVLARFLRGQPVYGWFALSCLLAGLDNLNNLRISPDVEFTTFEAWASGVRMLYAPAFMATGFAFVGILTRRSQRVFMLFVALLVAAVALSRGSPHGLQLIGGALLLSGLLGNGVILVSAVRRRSSRHVAWLLVQLPPSVAAYHDAAMFFGGGGVEGTWLVNYASSFMLLLVAGLMGRDIARHVQTSRELTTTLEHKVAEQGRQLAQEYQRRLEAEQQQARALERESVIQDVHDGVGSTLVSARILLERGDATAADAARVLQECTDDLRIVVDTFSNSDGRLESSLADLKHRLRTRLKGAPLKFSMTLDLDDAPAIGHRVQLQLLRILQEAVSNSLRHAHAKTLDVSARWIPPEQAVVIEVMDDGVGVDHASTRVHTEGRGLRNMARRALAIGAELHVEDTGAGTRVRLMWKPQAG